MEIIGNGISGIYKILNIINGKFYIGSSYDIGYRLGRHVYKLKVKKHHSKHLQSAWHKYGESSFTASIIEETNIENLLVREQYWLDITQCYNDNIGYNISKEARSPNRGHKHSENAKERISFAGKGKLCSYKGIKLNDERKKLISDGIRKNLEHLIAVKLSWDKIKEIRNLFDNGECSIIELQELYNVSSNSIRDILSNRTWVDDNYVPVFTNKYLPMEIVRQIRKDYIDNKYKSISELARNYKIDTSIVNRIIHNKIYIDPEYKI